MWDIIRVSWLAERCCWQFASRWSTLKRLKYQHRTNIRSSYQSIDVSSKLRFLHYTCRIPKKFQNRKSQVYFLSVPFLLCWTWSWIFCFLSLLTGSSRLGVWGQDCSTCFSKRFVALFTSIQTTTFSHPDSSKYSTGYQVQIKTCSSFY